MRKRKFLVGALVAALAVSLGVAGVSYGAAGQKQTILLGVKPLKLPKVRKKPVALHVKTTTTNPSAANQVPSPATLAQVNFDNDLAFFPGVAARCPVTAVANKSTANAKLACPKAIVGGGAAEVFVPTGPTTHVVFNAEITEFNGLPSGGNPTIILHNYVPDLALGQDLIGVLRKSHAGRDYGKRLDVSIPPLPLGAALTRFDTRSGNGFKRGYVKARCHDRNHRLNTKALFRYQDGSSLPASSSVRCRIKR
jgi:hypothetical protein